MGEPTVPQGEELAALASARRLDGLFVEAGRRCHLAARLDGSWGDARRAGPDLVNPPGGGTEGLWVEPLRLLDALRFYLWEPGGEAVLLERHCVEYRRELGCSRLRHLLPQYSHLRPEKRVWVPRHWPAAVFELSLENGAGEDRTVRVALEVRSSLGLGWPRRERAGEAHRFRPELDAVEAWDPEHPEWVALWGADRGASDWQPGRFDPAAGAAGPCAGRSGEAWSVLRYELAIPAGGTERLRVVVAGGTWGRAEAERAYTTVQADAAVLWDERVRFYRSAAARGPTLSTPEPTLDRAFRWAKVSLEDFKHFDPALGLGYFAGFPAYNFYFASDSLRLLYGAIAVGDWDDTREVLRTILRYQAVEPGPDVLPGEIWHEMSTSGERISPNFCTLELAPLVESLYRWTGDRAFLEEVYPCLRAAVEWGYLKDADGDGLVENGPEGEMADEADETTNLEGSHLLPNLAWCRALRAGARLARLLGDLEAAERWWKTAGELAAGLNQLYWSEERRGFHVTLRPDGTLDWGWDGLAVTDAQAVDEGKVELSLDRLEAEELALSDAQAFALRREVLRARSRGEAGAGGELRPFYYVVDRGDRVRHLLAGHRVEPGLRGLVEISRLPFTVGAPGHLPEVVGLYAPGEGYLRGCAHQAWSGPCGILLPVVAGLFGLDAEASSQRLQVMPHLPREWPGMRLADLPVGEHRVTAACRRQEGWVEVEVAQEGPAPLQARIGLPLPATARVIRLEMDGQPIALPEAAFEGNERDGHLFVGAEVAPLGSVRLRAHLCAPSLLLDVPPFLERSPPGATVALPVRLRHQGPGQWQGSLALRLPDGLGRTGSLEQALELAPGEERLVSVAVEVPEDAREGYHTLRVSLQGGDGTLAERPVYLPVFGPVEARLDGREVTRLDRPYGLRLSAANLTPRSQRLTAELRPPPGLQAEEASHDLDLASGGSAGLDWSLRAQAPGTHEVVVHLDGRRLAHRLEALQPGRRLVVYSGFLACPLASSEAIRVANLPANYAVRHPHVLTQWLAQADLLLASDQQDAVLDPSQIAEILRFVEEGGRLLLFCYWSSPWGRGFHHTLATLAGSRLEEALPLAMGRGILTGRGVALEGPGLELLADLPWERLPPYDHNLAAERPGAVVWARSEAGHPLLATGRWGAGSVGALALDGFGYGSYGTFLAAWPAFRELLGRVVGRLLTAEEGVHGAH